MSADEAIHAVRLLAGIGVVVTSCELLYFLVVRPKFALSPNGARVVLFSFKSYRDSLLVATCILRLFAGLCCAMSIDLEWSIFGVTVTSAIVFTLLPQAQSGAEQFSILVFGSLLIDAIVKSPATRHAVLVFLTAQLCLAYAAAGVFKILSRQWRNGEAIQGILGTRAYGNLKIYSWMLKSPKLSCALGWSVFAWEVAFPLSVLNHDAAIGFIVVGCTFHVLNTILMGLNNFLWAFCSAYPALLYVAERWSNIDWSIPIL